jgi:hypothetical protein
MSLKSYNLLIPFSSKRKVKCDKTQPCSTCRGRGEGANCLYPDGYVPPPQQSFVTMEKFEELERRVAELRDMIGLQTGQSLRINAPQLVTPVNTSPASSQDRGGPISQHVGGPEGISPAVHANHLELAFHRLDESVENVQGTFSVPLRYPSAPQVATPDNSYLSRSQQLETAQPKAWPTIFSDSDTESSGRRNRDMQHIISVMPHDAGMDVILEYFYSSVWLTSSTSYSVVGS